MTASLRFRFRDSAEWFTSPHTSAERAAEHALSLHSGRWPAGVRQIRGCPGWYQATGRGAKSFPHVHVAAADAR